MTLLMPARPFHQRPDAPVQALEQAMLALRSQRFDEAERLAAGVLDADRADAHAAQILGTALLLQGRGADALAPLAETARRTSDPAVETLLARALAAAGRRGEAIATLHKATERRPAYPLAFLELGEALGADGRPSEGVAVLESGLALVPAADGLRIALGYLHLQRNDRGEARRCFEDVRRAAPDRGDAMVGLAKVMALDGDHAGAAELYRRALAVRPQDVGSGLGLAKSLLELGERAAGEAALRTTVDGAAHLAGLALSTLAASSHGRFFLRASAARRFLGVSP
ncbi:MAG: tetratricopeptide repeat protein [Phenylobacterium sp.]|nr:tetratricopeptide repeat protein [Phenylobacterium sp.]